MPDPITITTITAGLLTTIGGGVLSDRASKYFDQSLDKIYKRLKKSVDKPENHVILKAVRKACLNGTLNVCQYLIQKYPRIRKGVLPPKKLSNLKEIERYLKDQIIKADTLDFRTDYASLLVGVEGLINPNKTFDKDDLLEITKIQKALMLQELDDRISQYVGLEFRETLLHGWQQGDLHVDWWLDLVCGSFAKQYRTNTELRSILDVELLTDIKTISGEIILTLQQFQDYFDAISNTYSSLEEILIRSLDRIETTGEETLATVKIIKDLIEGKNNEDNVALKNQEVTPDEFKKSSFLFIQDSTFKRLKFYDVEDAEVFFGREKYIDTIISEIEQRINSNDHAAIGEIYGVSGSGKSSLLRAGIIGNLIKKDEWFYQVLRPAELDLDPNSIPLINFMDQLYHTFNEKLDGTLENHDLEIVQSNDLVERAATIVYDWLDLLEREYEIHSSYLIIGLDQFEEIIERLNTIEINRAWASFFDFIYRISTSKRVVTLLTVPENRRNKMRYSSSIELRKWFEEDRGLSFELYSPDWLTIKEIIEQSFQKVELTISTDLLNGLKKSLETLRQSLSFGSSSLLPLVSLSISKIYDHWYHHDRKEARRLGIIEKEGKPQLRSEYSKGASGFYDLTFDKYGHYANLSEIINQEASQALEEAKRDAGPAFIERETLTNLLRLLISILHNDQIELKTVPPPLDPGQKAVVKHFKNRRLITELANGDIRLTHESIIEHYSEAKEWKQDEKERLKYLQYIEKEKAVELWEELGNVEEVIDDLGKRVTKRAGEFLYTWSIILNPPSGDGLHENHYYSRLRLLLIEFLKYQNQPRTRFTLKKSNPSNFNAAISCGAFDLVKYWLQDEVHNKEKSLIELIEPLEERSVLFNACFLNRLEIVKLLLENKANPNKKDIHGWFPVQAAAIRGHFDIVKLLGNHMYTINVKGKDNVSTLSLAARMGHGKLVRLILKEAKEVIQDEDKYGRTPLMDAALGGHHKIIKRLLDYNSGQLDNQVYFGYTALLFAIKERHLMCVRNLVKMGANLDLALRNGLLPIHYAAYKGETKLVQELIKSLDNIEISTKKAVEYPYDDGDDKNWWVNQAEPKINQEDTYWINKEWKALHFACFYGHKKTAKTILKSGASLTAITSEQETPLHLAAERGDEKMVEFLLKYAGEELDILNMRDQFDRTPLIQALEKERFYVAQLILEKQGDINERVFHQNSLLHHYATYGNLDQFKFLITNGARENNEVLPDESTIFRLIDAKAYPKLRLLLKEYPELALKKSKSNVLPLSKAILLKDIEAVNILTTVSFEQQDIYANEGLTPLHHACLTGVLEIVEKILSYFIGLKLINQPDHYGWTPLHYAILSENIDIVALLIKRINVAMHHQSPFFYSPIQLAVIVGNVEIVKQLYPLSNNYRKTKEGYNFLHLAVKYRHFELAYLLAKEYGFLQNMTPSEKETLISLYTKDI